MAGLPLYHGFGAPARPAPRVVAVGSGTRAWREGIRPGVPHPAAPPPGAVPATGPGSSGAGASTLPTGSYNPSRDVEVEEGQRGLRQLEGTIGTGRTRTADDFFASLKNLQTGLGNENSDFARQQEQLKRAFSILAGKQTEQANRYGVLGGGALLQSAAARAGNEGRESQQQTVAHQRRTDALNQEIARLFETSAPPDATNPLGGRAFQNFTTQLTNAQANQAFFGESQGRLAGQEAAERGYEPPPSPGAALHRAAAAPRRRPAPARSRDPFARYRRGL